MTREQRLRILSRLNGRSRVDAFEAAKIIWEYPDKSLQQALIKTLKTGARPFNRAAAAFAMQIVSSAKTIRALENTVRNKSESPSVRGEAAEALAHCHHIESHGVLLRALVDPSKEVRFWCAFALREMAETRAIPTLEHLAATDKRVVRGFHAVAKEAADAIRNIEKEKISHRRRVGCVFCTQR